MNLFYSPFHTFVHKALVMAHQCGHWEQLKCVATFPFKNALGEDQFGLVTVLRRSLES
jgi:glutathione S-transferase